MAKPKNPHKKRTVEEIERDLNDARTHLSAIESDIETHEKELAAAKGEAEALKYQAGAWADRDDCEVVVLVREVAGKPEQSFIVAEHPTSQLAQAHVDLINRALRLRWNEIENVA